MSILYKFMGNTCCIRINSSYYSHVNSQNNAIFNNPHDTAQNGKYSLYTSFINHIE